MLAGLAAIRLLSAESVTPATADAYIFHKPLLTNGIRGVVMGWPPAYRVIRGEDLDWVYEAWREREAIKNGTTNGNIAPVGAVVKRSDVVRLGTFWNGWPRDDYGWLDGDAELTTHRIPHPSDKVTTNVYAYAETASITNGGYYYESYTNGNSVITMPMTNGTTSVFSNRWSWAYYDPAQVTLEATNVHNWTILDWCQADATLPFPGNTNAPRKAWAEATGHRFPTVNAISNFYQNLQSTVRLADVFESSITYSNAPAALSIEGVNGTIRSTTTQAYTRATYYLSASTHTNGQWSSANESTHVTPAKIYVPTRFRSYLNALGGAQRVELEAAFVDAHFYYYFNDLFSGTRTIVETNVLMRVLSEPLVASGERMYVPIPWNAKTICEQAAIGAGVDPPSGDGAAFTPGAGKSYAWYIYSFGFVFIYKITPSVKLSNW